MSWVPRSSRSLRVLCGLAVGTAVAGGALLVNGEKSYTLLDSLKGKLQKEEPVYPPKYPKPQTPSSHLGKVLASWTTNFEPSVPWDLNWDR